MQERRSLYWRLNWYRQSELEGALLLGRMVRHVRDRVLIARLTSHCADEARHAWLWTRTLDTLGLPGVRIRRTYQSFYLDETPTPRTVTEMLALTHIFEQRVHRHFTAELLRRDLPDAARATFITLLRDEQGHLDWIAAWLSVQPEAGEMLDRYRGADERVVQRLMPYGERLWDVPGLGEELAEKINGDYRLAAQEFHPAEP
jgi:hypothetical protein